MKIKKVRIELFIYYIFLGNKYNDIKDTFERLKLQLNEKISKCETLLDQKEQLQDAQTGKELVELKKIENKIEDLLQLMEEEINDLEKELKSQKKKPKKYPDIETKDKIFHLLKEKINILKKTFNGDELEEDEIIDNRTALEKFEEKLQKQKNMGDSTQEREIFKEEEDKIKEWDEKKNRQNEGLNILGEGIKNLKHEVKNAGEGINEIGKIEKKTGKNIDKTKGTIQTQNERLKELVNKIRGSDKICCDIILILILLGLICVLYSIIKHKVKK